MTRREIRDRIFKILFSYAFNDAEEMSEQVALAFEDTDLFQEEDTPSEACSEEEKAYISNKVMDIVAKRESIDETIQSISEGWKLARIGKAELAILRLAVYEIKYEEEIPLKVSINEAVELTKRYCDTDAKSFVNALLAKLA